MVYEKFYERETIDMFKSLKLAKPFIKTFPNLTHLLAIIQDIPTAKIWYINHFIQIQINEDVSYENINANFCFGDFINPFIKCPFLKTEKISKRLMQDYDISLYSMISRCIDVGQYLCVPVDWFYIPCSDSYQINHVAHELLISGYDTETGEIEITDFFKNGHYSTERCSIEFVEQAFDNLPPKFCLLDDYIFSFELNELNYSFNVELAVELLSDYFYCKNPHMKFNFISKYFDLMSEDLFVFGLNTYEVFVKHVDKFIEGSIANLDVRSFYVLHQHKEVLKYLFEFIYEGGYIFNDKFIIDFAEVLKQVDIIKNLVLKSNIIFNIKTLELIKKKLLQIQTIERGVFQCVLDNIQKKPRLHRQDKGKAYFNSVEFKSIDTDTKGDWIETYGSICYDIFIESKKHDDIKVLYYNFIEKIWNKEANSQLALQMTTTQCYRIAMCRFFKRNAYIDILIQSDKMYYLSIYILDICSIQRDFEIKFFDGDSNMEILSVPLKVYEDGVYFKFAIKGHIRVEFVNHISNIGVVSGVFFDDVTNIVDIVQ